MNTCRFTIDYHALSDQCGDDMITHAIHVEPINITAPQWVIEQATRHMCADKATEHGHFLPDIDPAIQAMAGKGLTTLVVLAPDYWDIEDAFWSNGVSPIADRIQRIADRPDGVTALLVDLGAHMVGLTTREKAWDAK